MPFLFTSLLNITEECVCNSDAKESDNGSDQAGT